MTCTRVNVLQVSTLYLQHGKQKRKWREARDLMAESQSQGQVWIFRTDCNFSLLGLRFSFCETGPLDWRVPRDPSMWATVHIHITEGLGFFLNELLGLFFLLGNDDNVKYQKLMGYVIWKSALVPVWVLCCLWGPWASQNKLIRTEFSVNFTGASPLVS